MEHYRSRGKKKRLSERESLKGDKRRGKRNSWWKNLRRKEGLLSKVKGSGRERDREARKQQVLSQ